MATAHINPKMTLALFTAVSVLMALIASPGRSDWVPVPEGGCVKYLAAYLRAAQQPLPGALHVAAIHTIVRPEKKPEDVIRKLMADYEQMLKVQGRQFVETAWPTVDAYIAWYYNEKIELAFMRRQFEEEIFIRKGSTRFVRRPQRAHDYPFDLGFDYHEEFFARMPKRGNYRAASIRVNHDKKSIRIYPPNKTWLFPEYETFGTFSKAERQGAEAISSMIEPQGDLGAVALKLCAKKPSVPFYYEIEEAQQEGNPVLEFKLYLSENDSLIARRIVNKEHLGIVYESHSYANDSLVKSRVASDFQDEGGLRYPRKVTITDYGKEPGPVTMTFKIQSVSTNVTEVDVVEYQFPEDYEVLEK